MSQESAELPEDVLVEVFRRLAPHSLAACRWVCKAWRDAVDGRLRSHLLSRSVRGIFINYMKHDMSEFFSRPSTGPAICGGLDFLPCKGFRVKVTDHCNGLVLCRDWDQEYVANPATQHWARLPQRPPPHIPGFGQTAYLAFDHAVSPHYEVYLIPRVPSSELNDMTSLLQLEWPPAAHVMHVFSSMTERWESKTFLREGEAGLFSIFPSPHLGRSMRGVYCAVPDNSAVPDRHHGLQLWYLDESCGQMKWVLKHDIELESFSRKFDPRDYHGQQTDKHWILQDVNYRKCSRFERDRKIDGNYRAPAEEKYEWNSDDDDNLLDTEHAFEDIWCSHHIGFLGFHPYKEMVFLAVGLDAAVAYDWNSSKFQYLGRIVPRLYDELSMDCGGINSYFPYTPCWMYEFPRVNWESRLEDEQLSVVKARWEKPVQGVFKINVDACFREEEMQGATGLVVRDHVGSLISAQEGWYAHAASLMIMEAIAIRDAVKLAMERG